MKNLKRRGDKQMADAHQAVADSHRIAYQIAELHATTQRLHDRFHGPLAERG